MLLVPQACCCQLSSGKVLTFEILPLYDIIYSTLFSTDWGALENVLNNDNLRNPLIIEQVWYLGHTCDHRRDSSDSYFGQAGKILFVTLYLFSH